MKPSTKVRNLYELVPLRRRPFAGQEDGTVEVLLPRYGENLLGRLLEYIFTSRPIRVHLDDIGTAVWLLCDGARSVQEIGESLREKFGDGIEPVYDRLGTFLEHMRMRGMIEWKR